MLSLALQSACVTAQSMAGHTDEWCCLAPCTTNAEFVAYNQKVMRVCCDEPSEDCSGGVVKVCNYDCARVLLPMHEKCTHLLSGLGKMTIDAAAAKCPQLKAVGGGH